MRTMTWMGVAAVLVFVLGMAGCGGGDSPPAASSPPATSSGPSSGPMPGMGGPPGAGSAAPEAAKPPADAAKAETKASDGEDDPWGDEKPTVSGAVGKALLRGFTQGGAAKTDEAPKFGR